MPVHKTRLFAVIYTPYYRLQCARQKRLQALPEAITANNQLELSIEKVLKKIILTMYSVNTIR